MKYISPNGNKARLQANITTKTLLRIASHRLRFKGIQKLLRSLTTLTFCWWNNTQSRMRLYLSYFAEIPELLSFITVVASWNRNIHLSMDWLVHLGRYWYKILGNRGEGYSHVNFRPNRYKKSWCWPPSSTAIARSMKICINPTSLWIDGICLDKYGCVLLMGHM